jgi:hypothetical protein
MKSTFNKEMLEENLKQSMHKNFLMFIRQGKNKENIAMVALKFWQSSNEEDDAPK